jgi:DNA-binding transcriptional LysR family regulator
MKMHNLHHSYPGDLLVHLRSFLLLAQRIEARPRAAFDATAQALGVDRTVLRRRIQALRAWVGAPLLSGRGAALSVTAAGRRLTERATPLLDRLDTLRELDEQPPELRIACTGTITTGLLPDVLVALRRVPGSPRVVMRRAGGADCARLIEEREVDVAIRRSTHPTPGAIQLCADRLWLIAPSGHAIARKRKITAAELATLPLVLYDAGSRTRARVLARLPGARIAIEVDGKSAALEYVRRGFGVGFLSAVPWQSVRFRGVDCRDVTSLFDPTRFEILLSSDAREAPAVKTFVEVLRRHAERQRTPADSAG